MKDELIGCVDEDKVIYLDEIFGQAKEGDCPIKTSILSKEPNLFIPNR